MSMNGKHIVIVGGVAGGASAAARARRHSEEARITIIERGPDVSFANCGLPYHVGGEIPDRGELALQTPESLRALLNVEVRTLTEVVAIDPVAKEVQLRSGGEGAGDSVLKYDELVLSPGAAPLRPPLPGIDDPRIVTLRNLQDMDRIVAGLAGVEEVVVVGAGFIGLEMAEQFHHLGLGVTLVELQEQVLPQLDAELALPLRRELQAQGVELALGDGIESFEGTGAGVIARLASGRELPAGLVILSIGVRPESTLAVDAGIAVGPRGHITVDAFQRTSAPNIYAVGDVCESPDPLLGGHSAVALGGPANRQGRTAADHIFLGERAQEYAGSIGTSIVRVFGVAAGLTGSSEKRLKEAGVSYRTVTVNGPSHASYYPGAETITLKLLWAPEDGRVLGGEAVGRDGVDKRLDVLATAIRGGMTIEDLVHLELAYAPPFGSARDVINTAGFAATNIRDGFLVPVQSLTEAGEQVVDVRPPDVAAALPVPGSVNIPLPTLRGRLDELDRSRPVYTVCQMGKTSYFAARILANHGFDARSILGGAYHQAKRPGD